MDSDAFMHSSHAGSELLTRSSLIMGLQAFSSERWTNFVLVYAPMLKYWIRIRGASASAVDDIFQESLQSICVGIGGFQRDAAKGKFRGWLLTLVERRVADHFRARPLETLASPQQLESVPTPDQKPPEAIETEQQVIDEIRARAMELVRRSTTEKTWQMFWLATVEKVPTAEIAKQFGVSRAGVRVAKQRVLQRLRNLLQEDFGMPPGTVTGDQV